MVAMLKIDDNKNCDEEKIQNWVFFNSTFYLCAWLFLILIDLLLKKGNNNVILFQFLIMT